MKNDFDIGTGEYLVDEKKRYRSEDKTGHCQEIIEGGIAKDLQRIEIEKSTEILNLKMKVAHLSSQLRTLTQRVEVVEEHEAIENVIEIRNIHIEEIKKEMLTLLSDGKTRWADEIATELRLDAMDVIEAFNQLQKEDKLFVDNDKLQT